MVSESPSWTRTVMFSQRYYADGLQTLSKGFAKINNNTIVRTRTGISTLSTIDNTKSLKRLCVVNLLALKINSNYLGFIFFREWRKRRSQMEQTVSKRKTRVRNSFPASNARETRISWNWFEKSSSSQ